MRDSTTSCVTTHPTSYKALCKHRLNRQYAPLVGASDGELRRRSPPPFPTPTSSARAVKQMVSYVAARPFLPDPRELRSCGEADGELPRRPLTLPQPPRAPLVRCIRWTATSPLASSVPDPRELRSCGEADGELPRRPHTLPQPPRAPLVRCTRWSATAPPAHPSPTPTSSARVVKQMVSYRTASSPLPAPHELRSCGASDGELPRRPLTPNQPAYGISAVFSVTNFDVARFYG